MATWTPKTTGQTIAASYINDLQTGKVDSDGTASPEFTKVVIDSRAPRVVTDYRPPDSAIPTEINSGLYDGFGILDQFPSGKMVMVYSQSDAHVGGIPAIMLMRTSTDQGFTWSAPTTISNEPGDDCRNAAGGVTPSGRLVIFYAGSVGGFITKKVRYIYSDDEGITWSAPADIPVGAETDVSAYGKLIEIGDGILLQSWYGWNGPNYTNYVIRSTDDGATWSASIIVVTTAATSFTEGEFAYLGGRAIIGLIRDDSTTAFVQVKSIDNGITWTNQGATTFDTWANAVPPTIRAYEDLDGRRTVICYYNNKPALRIRTVLGRDLLAGPAGWDKNSVTDLVTTNSADSGYAAVVHPGGSRYSIGYYYDGVTAANTKLKFFLYPTGRSVKYAGDIQISGLLDIASGRIPGLLMGADNNAISRTNATLKIAYVASPHYTNTEEPVCLLILINDAALNQIDFGGGAGSFNAVGLIRFLTAATSTTTAGTERMRIDAAGNVGIGKSALNCRLAVPGLPQYANDAAAGAGGLTTGDFYLETGTDPLRIAYKI